MFWNSYIIPVPIVIEGYGDIFVNISVCKLD